MAPLSSSRAPITTVSLDTATAKPKKSANSVFEALRYACWIQFVPLRKKT